MIIRLDNARSTYEEIIRRVKQANGKVVIFLGFDIDSLCSLRILVSLLRADNVRYEIVPVMNYIILENKLEEFKKTFHNNPLDNKVSNSRDIKAFIMINCGGSRDMSKMWFCDTACEIM